MLQSSNNFARTGFIVWILALLLAPPIAEIAVPQVQQRTSAGQQLSDWEGRVVLPGSVTEMTRKGTDLGTADPNMPIEEMILVLRHRAAAELELQRLLAAQMDPTSPEFHHWLSPEEFGQRFGLTDQQIGEIVHWLTAQGFTINEVAKGRGWINFSGSAAAVEQAFHTKIHTYLVRGEIHHGNAIKISMPRGLAELTYGVNTLDDFRKRSLHRAVRLLSIRPTPRLTQPDGEHFITPGDFAVIYNSNNLMVTGITGLGQTIAVVGRTDISISDVRVFRSTFGLPANDPLVIHNGTDPGIVSGEETEADLDVEWSGATAPQAAVDFVVSKSTAATDGIDLSAQYVVNHNLASVVSVSFGFCEAEMTASNLSFYNNLWAQAAAQGITAVVGAGDGGAAGCDDPNQSTATHGRAVSGLCTTPNNVCVGGTEFNEGSGTYWNVSNGTGTFVSAEEYIPEIAWNESGNASGGKGLFSGGGGASIVYGKPAFQATGGVPNDGARDVPDISLTAAAHDGYLICEADIKADCSKGAVLVISGTSASAPSFAGVMALVDQKTGQRQGNANAVLYPMAAYQYLGGRFTNGPGTPVFHDVTAGNNSVPGLTGFAAGPGYDQVIGLGSVDVNSLAFNWGVPAVTQLVMTGAPAPAQAGVPFTVTVTAEGANGQTIPSYQSRVHFSSSDSDSRVMLPADYSFTPTDAGVHTFTGITLVTLGSQTIAVNDANNGSITAAQATILVGPGSASQFAVSAASPQTAGSQFSFSVTAEDQFGHTATGYTGMVHFTSSDPQAVLPGNSTLANGTGSFNATLKTAGSKMLTAADTVNSSITGSANINLNAAPASQFVFLVPATAQGGNAFGFRLTAEDPFGNVAPSYQGAVTFTSSDGGATLPGTYTFVAGDNGIHIFSATLATNGSQTLAATDTAHSIARVSGTITVGSGDPSLHPIAKQIRIFRAVPSVIVGSFTDDDTAESGSNLSVSINWGDGTPADTSGTIVHVGGLPNLFSVMGSHTYRTKSRFRVTVTVTDTVTGGSTTIVTSTEQFGPRGSSF